MPSEKLDLSLLNFGKENLQDINNIFNKLVNEISNKLNLSVVFSKIQIKYIEEKKTTVITKDNIFGLGVSRVIQNNNIDISIYNNFNEYLPIILLREAFLCFVPPNLINKFEIGLLIELISESYLNEYKNIDEWKNLIRNYIVDYEFISTEIYHFEKFFKIETEVTLLERVKFILEFVRNNSIIIADGKENLHEIIIKEFVLKSSQLIRDDDIVETLRILIFIFYKVRTYKALMEYQQYFKKFKEEGLLKTELSLKRFSENVKWINNYSSIAPSYHITYGFLKVRQIFYSLVFHPLIEKIKVIQIIKDLKFYYSSFSSQNGFNCSVSGWIVCPEKYVKDILNFFNRLEEDGYLIKKKLFLPITDFFENFINLNYLREFYKPDTLIDKSLKNYDNKYEISFLNEFDPRRYKYMLNSFNILDVSILNRVVQFSMDGLGFERKSETLKYVKNDIIYQILMIKNSITKLQQILNLIKKNLILKNKIIELIKNNKKFGFFYQYDYLINLLKIINRIKNLIEDNSVIKNQYDIFNIIKNKKISNNIEDYLFFNKKEHKNVILNELFSLYFQNRDLFFKEINSYKILLNLLELCENLKIYNLNSVLKIIQEDEISNNIYSTKKDKLIEIQKEYKLKKISFSEIEKKIEKFSDPQIPLLSPILISTINTTNFAKFHIQMILNCNQEVVEKLNQIKSLFPRILINKDEIDKKVLKEMILTIYLPNIKNQEKKNLVSFLHGLFKKDILEFKRFFSDGFMHKTDLKEYFDLQRQEFFYTKDLFDQYYLYVQQTLGLPPLKPLLEEGIQNQELFFSPNISDKDLIEQIKARKIKEKNEYNIYLLNSVIGFQKNLKNYILDRNKFVELKKENFLKQYIKSIKFIPIFNKFGFSQYFLYIRPRILEKIDFKLLLINNFQKIYYPATIEENRPFFIKYVFPYRAFNNSYINWIRARRIISEYCLFFVKKIIPILNFNNGLNKAGWKVNAKQFKNYIQKRLFFPESNIELKSYDIGEHRPDQIYGLNSQQYKDLIDLIDLNVKAIFSVKKFFKLESKIIELVKEDLIIPFIKLKNLGFIEKIIIILPNVKKEDLNKLVEIFNFFNYGFIYEIEGEYFIIDYVNQESFESGLMIELYLPNIDLNEFFETFAILFSYFNIKHYLILHDLINGQILLKKIYRDSIGNKIQFGSFKNFNPDIQKIHYNPYKNLKWNEKDKIWINHKLFTEKFEPIYPDLI